MTPINQQKKTILLFLSFMLVAFGQPIWPAWIGALSSLFGFAFFWALLLDLPSKKSRFWLSTVWFSCVQLVQLFWLTSHPYAYIYAAYLLFSLVIGIQFGILSLFITPQRIEKWISLLGIASLWTLLEWSRLFFLSGYSWNPVGLALASTIYGLQLASIGGVFLLSFWVILTNLLALRAYATLAPKKAASFVLVAFIPYAFGFFQILVHGQKINDAPKFAALLVQPAFPAEEALMIKSKEELADLVYSEWERILEITKEHRLKKIDLIVLPECLVPFGTYSFVYPYEKVRDSFQKAFGKKILAKLPLKLSPLVKQVATPQGLILAVNNAFWAQALSNIFDAPLLVGLEDAEDVNGVREHYSAALYFTPGKNGDDFQADRYSKQVLVPMAEYIPFSFCQKLAAQYGIQGSFTCGKTLPPFLAGSTPFGVSICYEETFGHLVRESRVFGAQILANLTSDIWFPNSLLPYQHLEHSRLRTVENGIPLIRACNNGITGGIDSLGRTIAILGDTRHEQEWSSLSLFIQTPLYSYATLYTRFGNSLILSACFSFCLLSFLLTWQKKH